MIETILIVLVLLGVIFLVYSGKKLEKELDNTADYWKNKYYDLLAGKK